MPSRRHFSRGKRLFIRVARDFVAFLAVISTLVALYMATLGPRRSVVQARLAASLTLPVACAAGIRAEAPGKGVQAQQLLDTVATECESPDDGDDANGSDDSEASDSADDQDDDSDSDEMLVQRLEHALGTSFFELLWHETTRLSGVIHSPEPPPARRA